MGRPKRDDRQRLNGTFWVLCSGANSVSYRSDMALNRQRVINTASSEMRAHLQLSLLAYSSFTSIWSFSWLKGLRLISTRYDKLMSSFKTMVVELYLAINHFVANNY